jgi:hypothetical protein
MQARRDGKQAVFSFTRDQPDHPAPRRFRACIRPIRANIIGPLFSAASGYAMRCGQHLFHLVLRLYEIWSAAARDRASSSRSQSLSALMKG